MQGEGLGRFPFGRSGLGPCTLASRSVLPARSRPSVCVTSLVYRGWLAASFSGYHRLPVGPSAFGLALESFPAPPPIRCLCVGAGSAQGDSASP